MKNRKTLASIQQTNMQSKKPVELLSKHLFWDTPLINVHVEKIKGFIVQRVMEYGLMNDWKLIKNWYRITE